MANVDGPGTTLSTFTIIVLHQAEIPGNNHGDRKADFLPI